MIFGTAFDFLATGRISWCPRRLVVHRAGLGRVIPSSSRATCAFSLRIPTPLLPSLLHPFATSTHIHTHPQTHSFHHGLPLLPRQQPSPAAGQLQLPFQLFKPLTVFHTRLGLFRPLHQHPTRSFPWRVPPAAFFYHSGGSASVLSATAHRIVHDFSRHYVWPTQPWS